MAAARRTIASCVPTLMIETIHALQDAGVEPDVWKIEGLDRREDCEKIVEAARRGGRTTVGCIVLGRGSDEQAVVRWLTVAAGVQGFIGFAVGRTTWLDAVTAMASAHDRSRRPPWPRSRSASASGRRSSSTCRSASGGGSARRQQMTHVPGDHQVFVGLHHAHDHAAAVARDDRRVSGVAFGVELETEELEALADAFADGGGVFADPGREDQRVEPAEHGGERAHGLPREVAKQGDGVGGAWIARLLAEQVAHVAAEPRHAEESGLVIDEPIQRGLAMPCASKRCTSTPGSRSPDRVPIMIPPVGVKPIVVSTLTPSRTAVRLAPFPRWAMMIRPCAAAGVNRLQRLDDELARQAVKAVPDDARVSESSAAAGTSGRRGASIGGTPCRSRRPAESPDTSRSSPG